jgi:hypothetical protein
LLQEEGKQIYFSDTEVLEETGDGSGHTSRQRRYSRMVDINAILSDRKDFPVLFEHFSFPAATPNGPFPGIMKNQILRMRAF